MARAYCFSCKSVCEGKQCEFQVPVGEGSHVTLKGAPKTWVADFVHGTDGFGNMNFESVEVRPSQMQSLLI